MIMKNVSRNKFLLCFRPVVDMDQLVIDSKNQPFSYHRKKAEMKNSSVPSSSSSSSSCSTSSDHSLVLHSPRKNFSRAIRAVFFETVLFKRVRDKKGLSDQDSCGSSRHSSSFKNRKALQIIDHHDNLVITNKVFEAHEDSKPDSFSSICTSEPKNQTMYSKTMKNQPITNQEIKVKPKKMDCSGIQLLLISLAMTVLWGKLCAILFTSIWLYFMPRRRPDTDGNSRPDFGRKVVEKKGSKKEYTKRVIMEGLLERNHRLSNQSHRERGLH